MTELSTNSGLINLSSEKWCIFKFFIDQLKSLMNMRNNKGHMIGSCGTPYLIVWVSDLLLSY